MMFRLDNLMHGGCRMSTILKLEKEVKQKCIVLDNKHDYLYDNDSIYQPVVINNDIIKVVSINEIWKDLGIGKEMHISDLDPLKYSLRKQME